MWSGCIIVKLHLKIYIYIYIQIFVKHDLMKKIKVLELYSGIGGLHYSLLQYVINYIKNEKNAKSYISEKIEKAEDIEVLFHFIAFDLNPIANETYYHNFKNSTVYLKSKNEIDKILTGIFNKKKSEKENVDMCYHENGTIFKSKGKGKGKGKGKSNGKGKYTFDENKNYIIQTDINNITLQFLESFQFNILLMSNPCQPYTRQNKNFKHVNLFELNKINKKIHNEEQHKSGSDVEPIACNSDEYNDLSSILNEIEVECDERVKSFIHICDLLQKGNVEKMPEFIFIENVKNFEISYSFLYFINSIKQKYDFQTYLLAPLQFGIPNERVRFYCICKKRKANEKENTKTNDKDRDKYESSEKPFLYSNSLIPTNFIPCNIFGINEINFYMPSLITFLDINEKFEIKNNKQKNMNIFNKDLSEFEVKKKTLQKDSAYCFDILNVNTSKQFCCVTSSNYYKNNYSQLNNCGLSNTLNINNKEKLHSMCFTSNYSRYINGTGSILFFEKEKSLKQENTEENSQRMLSTCEQQECNKLLNEIKKEKNNLYKHEEMAMYYNKVRYFTPTEISRLMGFKMKTGGLSCEMNLGSNEWNSSNDKNNNANNSTNDNNKNNINRNYYGNTFWNIDHWGHTCAYTPNIHYCSPTGNFCIFNDIHSFYMDLEKEENVRMKKEQDTCLCHAFSFPNFLTNRQKYKLIGNSVNAIVISLIFYAHHILENWDIKEH